VFSNNKQTSVIVSSATMTASHTEDQGRTEWLYENVEKIGKTIAFGYVTEFDILLEYSPERSGRSPA